MLFDPKWAAPVKADPYKLETLISWLEKQPAEKTYDFWNKCGECLFGQYMAAYNIPWEYGPAGANTTYTKIATAFDPKIAVGSCDQRSWNFGAALSRARALVIAQYSAT